MINKSHDILSIPPVDASQLSIEQFWLVLPEEIQEICLAVGGIPFSKEMLFSIVDKPDEFIAVLTSLQLLEEVSQFQLYQEASLGITQERNAMAITPIGPEPPYTKAELDAREARNRLDAYQKNPQAYPDLNKPLFFRFSKEFSEFVKSLDTID